MPTPRLAALTGLGVETKDLISGYQIFYGLLRLTPESSKCLTCNRLMLADAMDRGYDAVAHKKRPPVEGDLFGGFALCLMARESFDEPDC